MTFQELNLHQNILKAIAETGYDTPTPIQEEAIPVILGGHDLRASAQTGTGKTAAFLLPILYKLVEPSAVQSKGPRALILVPTRELALQVAAETTKYSKYLSKVKTVCIYGGAPYPIQNRELSRPHEVLVATPGRLIDHMERGRIDFSRLEVLVLDEADRMLDMGFIEPVEQIASATPSSRQTLLFSATLKGPVLKLANRLLKDPKEVSIEPTVVSHKAIDQRLYLTDGIEHKNKLLEQLLIDDSINQVIIFTSTKNHADELSDWLRDAGHQAAPLHGDMNQRQRTRTIGLLRQGKIKILVATDVAARGIDVQTITHVINFDLPNNVEDYVHRIGRTGRAGATGIALSFASGRDLPIVKRIEKFIDKPIVQHTVPGLEPKQKKAPQGPRQKPSFSKARRPSFGRRKESFNEGFSERPANNRFGEKREQGFGDRPSHNRFGDRERRPSNGNFGERKERFEKKPFPFPRGPRRRGTTGTAGTSKTAGTNF